MNLNLVPYSEDTLVSLMVRYNEAVWPLQGLILVAIAIFVLLMRNNRARGLRLGLGMCSLFWFGCSLGYYQHWLWALTWAAPHLALLCFLQGVGLGLFALMLKDQGQGLSSHFVGWGLIGTSLIYSILASLETFGIQGLPLAGLSPVASVIFTFGILGFFNFRRIWSLAVLPFFAAIFLGLESSEMGFKADGLVVVSALIFLWSALIRKQTRETL